MESRHRKPLWRLSATFARTVNLPVGTAMATAATPSASSLTPPPTAASRSRGHRPPGPMSEPPASDYGFLNLHRRAVGSIIKWIRLQLPTMPPARLSDAAIALLALEELPLAPRDDCYIEIEATGPNSPTLRLTDEELHAEVCYSHRGPHGTRHRTRHPALHERLPFRPLTGAQGGVRHLERGRPLRDRIRSIDRMSPGRGVPL